MLVPQTLNARKALFRCIQRKQTAATNPLMYSMQTMNTSAVLNANNEHVRCTQCKQDVAMTTSDVLNANKLWPRMHQVYSMQTSCGHECIRCTQCKQDVVTNASDILNANKMWPWTCQMYSMQTINTSDVLNANSEQVRCPRSKPTVATKRYPMYPMQT